MEVDFIVDLIYEISLSFYGAVESPSTIAYERDIFNTPCLIYT